MAGFGEVLRLFADKVERRCQHTFVGSVERVHTSVADGSPLTGAPGQPVDTGNLRASWQQTYPEEWVGEVHTNVVYAQSIEDGFSYAHGVPMTLRSPVGGFHSLKLTRASWDHVVRDAATEAKSTDG